MRLDQRQEKPIIPCAEAGQAEDGGTLAERIVMRDGHHLEAVIGAIAD